MNPVPDVARPYLLNPLMAPALSMQPLGENAKAAEGGLDCAFCATNPSKECLCGVLVAVSSSNDTVDDLQAKNSITLCFPQVMVGIWTTLCNGLEDQMGGLFAKFAPRGAVSGSSSLAIGKVGFENAHFDATCSKDINAILSNSSVLFRGQVH